MTLIKAPVRLNLNLWALPPSLSAELCIDGFVLVFLSFSTEDLSGHATYPVTAVRKYNLREIIRPHVSFDDFNSYDCADRTTTPWQIVPAALRVPVHACPLPSPQPPTPGLSAALCVFCKPRTRDAIPGRASRPCPQAARWVCSAS